LVDVDGDGAPEVLMTSDTGDAGLTLQVFKLTGGHWREIGELSAVCADSVAALRAGRAKLVAKTGVDVEVAGRRLALVRSTDPATCSTPAQAPSLSQAAAAKVSPVSHGADKPER
jgi:hypothetical protein